MRKSKDQRKGRRKASAAGKIVSSSLKFSTLLSGRRRNPKRGESHRGRGWEKIVCETNEKEIGQKNSNSSFDTEGKTSQTREEKAKV